MRATPEAARPFTFDGVVDRSRVDSYYDPFGNLVVAQRALLEIGRERAKLGEATAAQQALEELMQMDGLGELRRHQLAAYWDEFVLRLR